MSRLFRSSVLIALALGAMMGCRTGGPKPDTTFADLPWSLDAPPYADASLDVLKGRHICVDPGHGGPHPGTTAPSNGLREQDVNLAVSLRLQAILEQAGADVLMTRTDDTVLAPESLSRDLTARANLANEAGVEVFVSVHHNADINPDSGKNNLEVYYKLGEDGASRDLGEQLTRSISRHLRTDDDPKLLLPGNYKVLRVARMPAVLLESSYMSHTENAAFLATNEGIEREARAIAHGLADYFATDPPQLAGTQLVSINNDRTQVLQADFSSGVPLDLDTIRVTLNDEPAPGDLEPTGRGFLWTFRDTLSNGDHAGRIFGRNRQGAAFAAPVTFRVDRAAQSLDIATAPENPAKGVEVMFEARAYDGLGLPVADGTKIGCTSHNIDMETTNGIARCYIATGDISGPVAFTANTLQYEAYVGHGKRDALRTIRVMDDRTGLPVSNAAIYAGSKVEGVTTPEGWIAIPAGARKIQVSAPGYVTETASLKGNHDVVKLNRVAGGALHGRVIVIDPAHGGRDAGTHGPTGLRSSDVALDVAQRAVSQLQAAGAEVYLTRTGDREVSEVDRVRLTEEVGAELMVSITFGSPASKARTLDLTGHARNDLTGYVGHYPGSRNGLRLAGLLADELNVSTTSSVAYVVQQTGCPAVIVQPEHVGNPASEQRYAQPDARRAAAAVVYRALAEYFTDEKEP